MKRHLILLLGLLVLCPSLPEAEAHKAGTTPTRTLSEDRRGRQHAPKPSTSQAEDGIRDAISTGYDHTCGIREDGTVACWGDNSSGQATPASGQFVQISVGTYYTCGVRVDGTVACWGTNDYGKATPPSGSF